MDALGDRCKKLEMAEAGRRSMPGLPLIARLDGRAFHTFTRNLERPYDARMSRLMIETTRFLVGELNARVGYTQSDEITLAWYEPSDSTSAYPFDGRYQKMTSVLAGLASAFFCKMMMSSMPEKQEATPCFDCRVWQVPTLKEALEVFVWREDDATKNSISMAASAYYDDATLKNKDGSAKQELLFQKGINWNDYPAFFKRGSYLGRRAIERQFTDEEWQRIPEAHRPPRDQVITRHQIVELELPPIRKLANAIEVLFQNMKPTPAL